MGHEFELLLACADVGILVLKRVRFIGILVLFMIVCAFSVCI